jgi:hypothetical protein
MLRATIRSVLTGIALTAAFMCRASMQTTGRPAGCQTIAQPGRQWPRLDADPFEGQSGRSQERCNGIGLACGLAFAHDPALIIDDADRRLFHRDVETDILLHGCPP